MTTKKTTDQSAASFAAQAQREFGELRSALSSARSSLARLNRTLRVAVPSGGSRTIKGSRTRPSVFETAAASSFGGLISGGIVSGGGDLLGDLFGGGFSAGNSGFGSFQQSSGQFAGKLLGAMVRGQRVM